MIITFVQPQMIGVKKKNKYKIQPPVYAKLKAYTPDYIECRFFDNRMEDIDFEAKTDIVAISLNTFSAADGYKIAQEYKKRGVYVVIGGVHAYLLPDEISKYADSVLIGEIELVWEQFIADYQKGNPQKFYTTDRRHDMNICKMDRSIFDGKKYLPIDAIETSRGCHFNCKFCAMARVYKQCIIYRDAEDVYNEIKSIPFKYFRFIDENFGNDIAHATRVIKKIIPLKKKWFAQMSVNSLLNEDFVKLLKKSGCTNIYIGFESINKESLEFVNKKSNFKIDNYQKAINNCIKNDIIVSGGFIVGLDPDNKDSIEELFSFANKTQLLFATFANLIPTPGTPIYEELEQQNRLIYPKWWLEDIFPQDNALYLSKNFTSEEMQNLGNNLLGRYYSYKNIFKRFINSKYKLKTRFVILFGNIFIKLFNKICFS